mgnify:CR=1 FL=1
MDTSPMQDVKMLITGMGRNALAAARELARLTPRRQNTILTAMADAIDVGHAEILAARFHHRHLGHALVLLAELGQFLLDEAGEAAHRQPHLFERFARELADALVVAGVHDGQQLGAQVVVQIGSDALALALGDLLDLQLGELGEVALDLRGGLADAHLQLGAVLAIIMFSITVISIPLLMEKELDIVTAMITSVNIGRLRLRRAGAGAGVPSASEVSRMPGVSGSPDDFEGSALTRLP